MARNRASDLMPGSALDAELDAAFDPALNPQIARLLEMIARSPHTPFSAMSPSAARSSYERNASILDIAPRALPRVDELSIETRDGGHIGARLYYASEPQWATPLPVLVFFHGGGFTVGSVRTHDALTRMLAAEAHCAVLSVDYRLAPEQRFPTAHDDAFDAVRWLFKHAAALGLDARRVALGGDSAGGTLATVCAVQARDAGLPLVLQLLIYPGTCARQDTPSHRRLARGYLLDASLIQWFFAQYLRSDAERDDWRFAPLDGTLGAPDFSGLAPAWIGVAEFDPLVDEGRAYADKLRAAGNDVTLHCYAGMIHEFFKMGRFVPAVASAHAEAAAALRRAFGAD